MKVAVITPRYAISGVPLAQLRFARALAARGFDVDLLVGRADSNHQIPKVSGVRTHVIGKTNVRGLLLPLVRYFAASRPDIVFSAEDHLNAVVLIAAILTGSHASISGSSRVTPFDTYSDVPLTKRWLLKQIMRFVMWRANVLTCVSQGTVDEYRQVFSRSRHVCVYNIIDDQYSRERMHESVGHRWLEMPAVPVIVAAGSLAPWKGYGDLLLAIKILSKRKPIKLIILGDGPLRAGLLQQVEELELTDVVDFPGYVENPLKYLSRADVFAHSAHVESLGNVLVEAMMCGCTPVSTDCPTGPREVLENGRYGYLVPVGDAEAMASAIELALDKPIPPEILAEGVRRFEEAAVLDRHFGLLGLSDSLEFARS